MFIFTYNDYLDYVQNAKIQKKICNENKRIKVQELLIQNQKLQDKQNTKVDELLEKLLEDEGEIANFINDFFKISNWKISMETIKKLYVLRDTKTVIYKYNYQEVYFFIKLQKQPNYSIIYNILNECIIFFDEWKKKCKRHTKPPIIVPIVIYAGKEIWNVKQNRNIKYTTFQSNSVNLFYNFVDLQKFQPITLIKKKSLISKISVLKMPISYGSEEKLMKMLKNKTNEFDIFLQIAEFEAKYINSEGVK